MRRQCRAWPPRFTRDQPRWYSRQAQLRRAPGNVPSSRGRRSPCGGMTASYVGMPVWIARDRRILMPPMVLGLEIDATSLREPAHCGGSQGTPELTVPSPSPHGRLRIGYGSEARRGERRSGRRGIADGVLTCRCHHATAGVAVTVRASRIDDSVYDFADEARSATSWMIGRLGCNQTGSCS